MTSGFVAPAAVLGMDLLLSWLCFRSPRFGALVEGRPRPLIRDGKLVEPELRRSRISRDELVSRLRRYGVDRLEVVETAWLERDGDVTFVLRGPARRRAAPPAPSEAERAFDSGRCRGLRSGRTGGGTAFDSGRCRGLRSRPSGGGGAATFRSP